MSKKDYITIASVLRSATFHYETQEEADVVKDIVSDLADQLKRDNPRFNTDKFESYIFGAK